MKEKQGVSMHDVAAGLRQNSKKTNCVWHKLRKAV